MNKSLKKIDKIVEEEIKERHSEINKREIKELKSQVITPGTLHRTLKVSSTKSGSVCGCIRDAELQWATAIIHHRPMEIGHKNTKLSLSECTKNHKDAIKEAKRVCRD